MGFVLIYEYMEKEITRNGFDRAFKTLRAINLITEKGAFGSNLSRFELHPIVRAFVWREYINIIDRYTVLDKILSCCDRIVLKMQSGELKSLSVEVLEQLAAKTEMTIARGKIPDGIKSLFKIRDELINRGIYEEFIRLAVDILDQTDIKESPWVNDDEFPHLIDSLTRIMVEIGRIVEIREYLDSYAQVVPRGTARYIGLCETMSYAEWFDGNYPKSIEWSTRGIEIKKKSGLDTVYDPSHNLALAQRDSGDIDKSLKYFCFGKDIESILKENHLESKRPAHYYGNIGRCLALKKRIREGCVPLCKII